MAIEPEIPYYLDSEGSSDDENINWRNIRFGDSPSEPSLIDISEELDATLSSSQSVADTTATSEKPDDHWVLPALVEPEDILGICGRSRINAIQKHTGSFIQYNKNFNQVNIWGDAASIAKTMQYLDEIAQNTVKKKEQGRRTKKWERPERELTAAEQRRAERRQAKIDQERMYRGLPAESQAYNGTFPLPNSKMPLLRFVGENESYFNQIRIDCRAFIWYEEKGNLVRIVSDNEEAVKVASNRIQNWYLRCVRKLKSGTLRLLQQPKAKLELTYRLLPFGFITSPYISPEKERNLAVNYRMLQKSNTGNIEDIKLENLIKFGDDISEEPLSEEVKTLNSRNVNLIQEQLSVSLESLRLNDWVIRLKIRFGQIFIQNYTRKKEEDRFMSIEYVSNKLFRNINFKSKLSPCISKTFQGLNGLFEYLAADTDAVEISDNPSSSYTIHAKQYPSASTSRAHGQKAPHRRNMWDTVLQISFRESGDRRLWRTITSCADLVDISITNMKSNYSWDLKLQHARSLPNDDVNAPHEKFAQDLHVSDNNRLSMVVLEDYIPQWVTQKTKWKFTYKGYFIEICQDEIWEMQHVEHFDARLRIDLGLTEPHRVLFKVSLIKESWVDRFAENLNSKIGQSPSWSIRDFLARPDENAHSVMEMANNIAHILNSTVPLYWDQSANSLV